MGRKCCRLSAALLASAMLVTTGWCRGETGQSGLTPEQERLERQKRVLEALQAERRGREEDRAKAEQEREQADTNCENAQQELSRRQNAAYLYRKGADGERAVFGEEERAKATADAEAAVKKWCE